MLCDLVYFLYNIHLSILVFINKYTSISGSIYISLILELVIGIPYIGLG